jgi:hypothetical protein
VVRLERLRIESGGSLFGSLPLSTPDVPSKDNSNALPTAELELEDDGFPIDDALIAALNNGYVYDPKIRPYVCRQLESGLDISPAPGPSEGCRAYRLFPANRFLWYQFKRPRSMDEVYRKLDRVIKHQGKEFVFLGTTESRLRTESVCFFQESSTLTAKDVRESLGDLAGVFMKDGPGKYVARMGLSFTKTEETIEVPPERMGFIEDVVAPDGKAYTDGCGCISEEAAGRVARALGLRPTASKTSCACLERKRTSTSDRPCANTRHRSSSTSRSTDGLNPVIDRLNSNERSSRSCIRSVSRMNGFGR